ncbi:hypothetical protein [Noviherbaspirillum sp.]|uniref:hypothetical protein n=1 Tax=Noviherbaspirillum sp. TaxID=1926288 RepID=UPI002B46CC89|nr:hypothetical protein [Noviherbaspirillum sp.]HJV79597.1 hypothetical protein [Noviherbaspirillum sp.]
MLPNSGAVAIKPRMRVSGHRIVAIQALSSALLKVIMRLHQLAGQAQCAPGGAAH